MLERDDNDWIGKSDNDRRQSESESQMYRSSFSESKYGRATFDRATVQRSATLDRPRKSFYSYDKGQNSVPDLALPFPLLDDHQRRSLSFNPKQQLTVKIDRDMQRVGSAIRMAYSPVFCRREGSESTDSEVVSIIASLNKRSDVLKLPANKWDDLESPHLRLKRSNTWSKTTNIVPPTCPTTPHRILETPVQESIIFSSILEKQNRHGRFQKRIVRFDGFMFVLLTDKRMPTTPKGRNILGFEPVHSLDSDVQYKFAPAVSEIYPTGTHYPSMANALIADSIIQSRPNCVANHYLVPKWTIPVSKILRVKYNDRKSFTLVLQDEEYHFRGSNVDIERWVYLLEHMTGHVFPETLHLACPVRGGQSALESFVKRAKEWNILLLRLVSTYPNSASFMTTLTYLKDKFSHARGITRNDDDDLKDTTLATTKSASSMSIASALHSSMLDSLRGSIYDDVHDSSISVSETDNFRESSHVPDQEDSLRDIEKLEHTLNDFQHNVL